MQFGLQFSAVRRRARRTDQPGLPMSTGARDQYWEQQRLPRVFKHDLLRRHLPVFAGKTGSRAPGVVYLDGFAGRGRYQDRTPASAEHILQIAEQQALTDQLPAVLLRVGSGVLFCLEACSGRVCGTWCPGHCGQLRGPHRPRSSSCCGTGHAVVPLSRSMWPGHTISSPGKDSRGPSRS